MGGMRRRRSNHRPDVRITFQQLHRPSEGVAVPSAPGVRQKEIAPHKPHHPLPQRRAVGIRKTAVRQRALARCALEQRQHLARRCRLHPQPFRDFPYQSVVPLRIGSLPGIRRQYNRIPTVFGKMTQHFEPALHAGTSAGRKIICDNKHLFPHICNSALQRCKKKCNFACP